MFLQPCTSDCLHFYLFFLFCFMPSKCSQWALTVLNLRIQLNTASKRTFLCWLCGCWWSIFTVSGCHGNQSFSIEEGFFFFFWQLPEGEEKYYKKRHKIADSTLQSVASGVQVKGSLNQHCPAKVYSGFRRFDRWSGILHIIRNLRHTVYVKNPYWPP